MKSLRVWIFCVVRVRIFQIIQPALNLDIILHGVINHDVFASFWKSND